jgi:XTP/dITP diphosphohydrolase
VNELTKTIVIATRNKGKAKEFEALFNKKGYAVQTLLDYPEVSDIEETGITFQENALLKAETIAEQFETLVLADDSGLKVKALHGQPGVYSARYAGEEKNDAKNNAKLLNELADVKDEDRTAVFHCSLALAMPGKNSLVVDGEVAGKIIGVPRGENGFGYDPLFYLEDKKKTMAELTEEEKNKISHRAVALENLESVFDDWLQNQ